MNTVVASALRQFPLPNLLAKRTVDKWAVDTRTAKSGLQRFFGSPLLLADETVRGGMESPVLALPLVRSRGLGSAAAVVCVCDFGHGDTAEVPGNKVAFPVNASVPYASTNSLGEWVSKNPKGV